MQTHHESEQLAERITLSVVLTIINRASEVSALSVHVNRDSGLYVYIMSEQSEHTPVV